MKRKIRIATRKSPLALWQANYVKDCLLAAYPDSAVELLPMLTTADKMLTTPLAKIGGKGLFVKELERAILMNEADLAVHSIKDMPAELPRGLQLAVTLKREDPRDAFISNNYASLFDMPIGATIGTSSLRRSCQLLALRPDLTIKPLRGNVGSRLQKLDEKHFDAIILAAAGVKRLGLSARVKHYFGFEQILPAAGQGAIGIECRENDGQTLDLIACLNDEATTLAVTAERVLNHRLGGSCQFPVAAYAELRDNTLSLRGLVGNYDGRVLLKANVEGHANNASSLGLQAAEDLIEQGALELLQSLLTKTTHDSK